MGWVMFAIGTLAIAALLLALAVGSLSWQRAGAAIFGVLAATVLSGPAWRRDERGHGRSHSAVAPSKSATHRSPD